MSHDTLIILVSIGSWLATAAMVVYIGFWLHGVLK